MDRSWQPYAGTAQKEATGVSATPDTKKALLDAGVEVAPSSPEAMADYMVSELERWGKVVKETGIKVG